MSTRSSCAGGGVWLCEARECSCEEMDASYFSTRGLVLGSCRMLCRTVVDLSIAVVLHALWCGNRRRKSLLYAVSAVREAGEAESASLIAAHLQPSCVAADNYIAPVSAAGTAAAAAADCCPAAAPPAAVEAADVLAVMYDSISASRSSAFTGARSCLPLPRPAAPAAAAAPSRSPLAPFSLSPACCLSPLPLPLPPLPPPPALLSPLPPAFPPLAPPCPALAMSCDSISGAMTAGGSTGICICICTGCGCTTSPTSLTRIALPSTSAWSNSSCARAASSLRLKLTVAVPVGAPRES